MSQKMPARGYVPLLALSALFTLGAIATLIPAHNASWENILGYRSLCTFAPIATACCALLAGTTCTIRRRFFGPRRGRKINPAAPVIIGLILVAVIGFSIPPYAAAKAEAVSGASAHP